MTPKDTAAIKPVANAFNAIARAWNEGRADWAYDDRGSVAVRRYNERESDRDFVTWAFAAVKKDDAP